MAKSTVQSDVHSLSVVWNSELVIGATGRANEKESWLKVKIEGAEGSVSSKFALLAESGLQFKVSTAQRERDAKASDTYYPRGLECAQLFAILGDCRHMVDMGGFNVQKWEKRFPAHSQATDRLRDYADMLEAQAEQARTEAEKTAAEALAKLEAEKAALAQVEPPVVVPDPETIGAITDPVAMVPVDADASNRITENAGSPPVVPVSAGAGKRARKAAKQAQPA